MIRNRRQLGVTLGLLTVAGALFLGAGLRLRAARAATPAKLTVTWLGQSCFILETASGTRVVTDPIPKGLGYELPVGLRADVVTVSHEHPDHNNVALVTNRAHILRGLTSDKKGWTKIDEKVKDIAIRTVGVYHDDKHGAERGLNSVFVFETAGLRVAHLGDLGHMLDDKQLSAIGSIDVALVPVGGHFTIDAQQASRVIDQLRPRLVVIPMHYRTAASTTFQLGTVEEFIANKTNVRRVDGNTLPLTAIKSRAAAEIVVLGWK